MRPAVPLLSTSKPNLRVLDFCQHRVIESDLPIAGVKAFAAKGFIEQAKKNGLGRVVVVSSASSSVGLLTAAVAADYDMECHLLLRKNDSKLSADTQYAVDKGILTLIPTEAETFVEADQLALQLYPNEEVAPPGYHTQSALDFVAAQAITLKQAEAHFNTVLLSVGGGWSLAGIIHSLYREQISNKTIVGICAHGNAPLSTFLPELTSFSVSTTIDPESRKCQLKISKDNWQTTVELLPSTQDGDSGYLMAECGVPLDPFFEASCVPELQRLLAMDEQVVFVNISCSPTAALRLRSQSIKLFP